MEHARRPTGRLFWAAVVAAVALAVGGGVLAYTAYQRNASAAGVVRTYFADLQRGDARAALSLGDVPHGSRLLLTDAVLEQQQRLAPLTELSVGSSRGSGEHATVPVSYTLGTGRNAEPESTSVRLHRTGDGWRLDRVAVDTQLMLVAAANRATVLGARVPAGEVLLFPGTAPVTFDTPYLQLSPSSAAIDFQTGPTIELVAQMSPAGKARATALVRSALQNCLRGHGTPGCPLPGSRYVPGRLRGTLSGEDPPLSVDVGTGVTGTVEVTGEVTVDATYQRLDFRNRPVRGEGSVQLAVHAVSLAIKPLSFVWEPA